MQERCGGEFSIDDHILRQTFSHAPDHPPQQALPGCVFAIARSVGFSIEVQRQAGAYQAYHHERMLMNQNLFRSVLLWPTEVAPLVGSPSRAGAVEGQADPAAIVEGFVALGAPDEGEQRLPRWASIEPLGEIAQGIVTERSCHGECASRRRNASAPQPHENSIRGGFGRAAGPRAELVPESGVVAARPLDSRDIVEGEDTASHNGADDVASDRSSLLFLKLLALLVFQHQQLCVGRQHFADSVLKLPPRSASAPYLFDPILGDVLATCFPLNHKIQRPDG